MLPAHPKPYPFRFFTLAETRSLAARWRIAAADGGMEEDAQARRGFE